MNAEVKPGYKLTEVGVIPEDWEVKCFAEIGNIKTGPFGTLLKASEYYAVEGVPLVSVRDIGEGKLTFDEHTPLVPILIVRRMPEYVLNDGDIVFGRKGGVDRSAIVQKHQAGCFLGSDGIRIRPLKVYHALFIAYQLQRKEIQAWLLKNSTGTTMPSMNQAILRRISLPIPTKAEQEAIAEALNDADALIESLEQRITKKRQIKQGAMQELLTGKKRLPGFSGEWKVKKLGDVVKISKGQLITEKNAISGDIPVIAGGKKPAYFHNKPNRTGMTITVSASGASAGYVAFFDEPIFASDCSTISEGNGYSIEFIYSQLLLKQEIIFKAQTGGAQPHIHAVDLMPIEIGFPSRFEQQAIARVFSDMDAEIDALEVKLGKVNQLKQGMMYILLTGKIRQV
jgi:type I restriction enzyme, S subunit